MTISPDNKLIIAKIPFYCQLMEWGKFPIYLTLKCINIFFCHHLALSFRRMPMRNGRLCHSDDCKEEESPLLCAQEKSLHFILSPTSLLSLFPVQVSIRFVTSYQNGCATYGNDCAKPLKRLCKVLGTVVPKACHSRAKGVAQACQRRGTSMPKAWHEQGILTKGLLSSSQAGITAWYGWQ